MDLTLSNLCGVVMIPKGLKAYRKNLHPSYNNEGIHKNSILNVDPSITNVVDIDNCESLVVTWTKE